MSNPHRLNRRDALKLTALAGLGLPLLGALPVGAAEVHPPLLKKKPAELKLGIASITLSKMSPDEVIAVLKQLQIGYVSLFRTHCPWDGTAEECHAAAQKFQQAGLIVSGCGVMALPNNEVKVQKAFENAHAAGLPTMVCKPDRDALPLVEKFAKKFDINLAIHNHGPEDKVYPSPYETWEMVQTYDRRLGLCIDVGHCARSGFDPAEAIRKCHTRLYDIHLKDSAAAAGAPKDIPTEVGRGHLDIKGILTALVEVKYSHVVAFEYEKGGKDLLVGLAESVAYVRKLLTDMNS